jgi:hypothetical protein
LAPPGGPWCDRPGGVEIREEIVKASIGALIGGIFLVSALLLGPARAQQWVPGNGQSCAVACSAAGAAPIASGTYAYGGMPFFVCRSNADNSGQRSGWNLPPMFGTTCGVASSNQEQHLSTYDCLCTSGFAPSPSPPLPPPPPPPPGRPAWCTQQSTLNAAEGTICGTPSLWPLEAQLNGLYRRVLNIIGGQRGQLEQSERDWLRVARNGCGANVGCLDAVYRQRINLFVQIEARGYMLPGE